uniref:Arb2 domain-containing protein n=1 Tax=Globisporangium ultimum (strain ATCC 200006 / CBS 805.95 / DAOM BR144) TaxID=431595 RepID=K3XAS6_GLOUD
MADTRRVFVQQATLTPQLQMSAPVMAFVEPEDSWLMIVNEFVASCNDEEVEVDDRPAGMLENCRILHASTLQLITDASGLDDGKQYILCPSTMEFEAVLRKHGLPVPAPPPGSASGLGRRAERDSIATTDHLESLEDLSYYFDSSGTLRHCASNQAVYEIMSDERRAGEIDEIVKAAIFHIQMDMLADLNFKQAHVPIDPRPDEPKEARSSVFLTSDWRTNDDLLIVINGGRGVQPGIWSRDLLIQEGLEKGSMLPVFRRAKESGFAVAVLNPFTNNVMIGKDLHPIRNNASSDEHTLYVWDNIISRSQAKRVHILAYSFGAKLVTTLIQNREEQVVKRLSGIVFAEGAYKIDPNSTSPLVGNFLKQKAINFKADSEVPEGNHIPSAEEQLSCMCLSVGDLAAAAAADGKY